MNYDAITSATRQVRLRVLGVVFGEYLSVKSVFRLDRKSPERGGKVYVGKHSDKEIDFVMQKPKNEREFYQVNFTVNDDKTFMKEIFAFKNIKDYYPKKN